MAYTGSQAIVALKARINAISTGGNWDNDDLLEFLNIALTEVGKVCPSDLLGTELGLNTTVTVIAPVANAVPEAAIPVSTLAIDHMVLGIIPVFKKTYLQVIEYHQANPNRVNNSSNANEKSHYFAIRDKLFFYPGYTTNQDYKLVGTKMPTAITTGAAIGAHEGLHQLIILYAAKIALESDGRIEQAMAMHMPIQQELQFLAKKYDADTQPFALAMLPGQPAPPATI